MRQTAGASLIAGAMVLATVLPAQAEMMVIRDAAGKDRAVEVPDGKNPWLTGIASFIIPGVGEMINGDFATGGVILVSNVALGALQLNTTDATLGAALGGARIGLNIGSAIGAAVKSNSINDKRDRMIKIHYSSMSDQEKESLIQKIKYE